MAKGRSEFQKMRALLRKRHPYVFPKKYELLRPLAVGIFDQIVSAHADINPKKLARFLRRYCNIGAYQAALYEGRSRVNLDGTIASEELAEAA